MEEKIETLSKLLGTTTEKIEGCIKSCVEKHTISADAVVNTLFENELRSPIPHKYLSIIQPKVDPIFKGDIIEYFYYDRYGKTLYFYGEDRIIYRLKTSGSGFGDTEDGVEFNKLVKNALVVRGNLMLLSDGFPFIYDLRAEKKIYFYLNDRLERVTKIVMKDDKVALYYPEGPEVGIILITFPNKKIIAHMETPLKKGDFQMTFVAEYLVISYLQNIFFYDLQLNLIKTFNSKYNIWDRYLRASKDYILMDNGVKLVGFHKTTLEIAFINEIEREITGLEVFDNFVFCADLEGRISVFIIEDGVAKPLKFDLLRTTKLKANLIYLVDRLLYVTDGDMLYAIDLSSIFEKTISITQLKALEEIFPDVQEEE